MLSAAWTAPGTSWLGFGRQPSAARTRVMLCNIRNGE